MKHSAQNRRRMRGVSIVEVLVALVIISVGMLGIAGLYLSSLQASRSANLRLQAVNLATDIDDPIERLAAMAADSTLDDIGGAAFLSDIAAMAHETQDTRLFRT